jgi:hypothetical protein
VTSTANVLGRRAGRIAFGIVLILGMASIAYETIHGRDVWSWFGGPFSDNAAAHPLHAGLIIAVTWAVAVVAYAIVRLAVWWAAPAPRGDALLRASLVVPAVGLALALPLGFHGLWFLITGAEFDSWVRMSVAVVGLSHLVFALTFGMHAAQLARGAPRMTIGGIFLWSTCASVIPWGIFVLPELLTLITGMLVLPVLYIFDALAESDRDALPALPRAKVA